MKHENIPFVDAVKHLAQKYNIELEETQDTEEEKQRKDERESLYIANKFAQEHFSHNLFETPEGKSVALTYFKERGFTKNTIENFQLGWAKDDFQDLFEAAKAKQYSQEVLQKNGLISVKNNRAFDFFRARVMFPIHNVSGKVVAFGGRTLSSDKKVPKYVNTGETDIYSKSRILYGMYQSKKAIRKLDNCFLVEGYTDVISLHQAGVENVVASSGTSLTVDQVKLIKRFTPNITLLFDGDAAGIKAAIRGVDIILEQDLNVKIVPLPPEDDPDSFIKKMGFSGFEEYVSSKQEDFILFKTNFLLKDGKNDPVKRADATREIINTIALIPDSIKRAFYVRGSANLLSIEEQLLHIEVNKAIRKRMKSQGKMSYADQQALNKLDEDGKTPTPQPEPIEISKSEYVERELVRILLEYGHFTLEDEVLVSSYVLHELEGVELENKDYQSILNLYKDAEEQDKHLVMNDLLKTPDENILSTLIAITNSPYELSDNWRDKHEIFIETNKEKLYAKEVMETISRYKLFGAMAMLREREEKLKSEEDVDAQIQLLKEINQIKHRVKEFSDQLEMNYPIH